MGKPLWRVADYHVYLRYLLVPQGPLVSSICKQIHADRFRTVAEFAAAMSLQTFILKSDGFWVAGFPLEAWLPLLACMVISGAWERGVGLRLLKTYARTAYFHPYFKLCTNLNGAYVFNLAVVCFSYKQ